MAVATGVATSLLLDAILYAFCGRLPCHYLEGQGTCQVDAQ